MIITSSKFTRMKLKVFLWESSKLVLQLVERQRPAGGNLCYFGRGEVNRTWAIPLVTQQVLGAVRLN